MKAWWTKIFSLKKWEKHVKTIFIKNHAFLPLGQKLFCFIYSTWMSFRKLLDRDIRKILEIAEQANQHSLCIVRKGFNRIHISLQTPTYCVWYFACNFCETIQFVLSILKKHIGSRNFYTALCKSSAFSKDKTWEALKVKCVLQIFPHLQN